jgi:hypothetical protein
MKNLQITRSHFAQSDALSVLVINIDSFIKDNNENSVKSEGRWSHSAATNN